MCNSVSENQKGHSVVRSIGDGSNAGPDLASPVPSKPDDHQVDVDRIERYILELETSLPRFRLRDLRTHRLLLELDEHESSRLMGLTAARRENKFTAVVDSLHPMQSSVSDAPSLLKAALTQPAQRTRNPKATPWEKRTRRKLWDLPENLHCPIVGTCLGVDELRTLARKTQLRYETPLSDHDVHVIFVSSAGDKNALSVAAQKALEKKFAIYVRRAAKAKTTGQLASLWKDALSCGKVPDGFWATITHPRCDEELRNRIREEVHMLSHQIGAGQRADLKRLAETQSELIELKRNLDTVYKRSREQLADREQRIQALEAGIRERDGQICQTSAVEQDLRRELSVLQASTTHLHVSKLEQQVERQIGRLRLAEEELDYWRKAYETSAQRTASLEEESREALAACAALERILMQEQQSCHDCQGENCLDCPDLRGRLILCVGGRNQHVDRYRALVSRCNGRFNHHDGGIEDNKQRLEAMLAAADVVVCATDCVSHNAYYSLKRFCKRHDKPYVFVRSSGVSTFARALVSVAS